MFAARPLRFVVSGFVLLVVGAILGLGASGCVPNEYFDGSFGPVSVRAVSLVISALLVLSGLIAITHRNKLFVILTADSVVIGEHWGIRTIPYTEIRSLDEDYETGTIRLSVRNKLLPLRIDRYFNSKEKSLFLSTVTERMGSSGSGTQR